MQIVIDGVSYDVKKRWTGTAWDGADRALIDYEGLFVFADQIDGENFELSGTPARDGEEKILLQQLVDTIQTTTTVTKP